MHSDHPGHSSARIDRRRGARVIAGVRITVGRREDHDGWMLWTPEARAAALRAALTAYFDAPVPPPVSAVERAHGIPAAYLKRHIAEEGHADRLPEPVRLARCALDIRLNAAAPACAARRWRVDSARAEDLAARCANPLTHGNTRRQAEGR